MLNVVRPMMTMMVIDGDGDDVLCISVIFYLMNFEHPLVLGKFGSKLSVLVATDPGAVRVYFELSENLFTYVRYVNPRFSFLFFVMYGLWRTKSSKKKGGSWQM